jgi:hypothetical protein
MARWTIALGRPALAGAEQLGFGRLSGDIVIEREDVRFYCFINPRRAATE